MGLSDKIAEHVVEEAVLGAAHGTLGRAEKTAEGLFDKRKEKQLEEFLERSIPSLIYKVKSGQWTAERASNFFNTQLKRLGDKSKANDLQNEFNSRLKGAADSSENTPANENPTVIIDGPSSLRSGQAITLVARTDGVKEPEDYEWQVAGKVKGIDYHPGDSSEGINNKYEIEASKDSEKGTLFITAFGKTSKAGGSFTVRALEPAKNGKDQTDDDREKEEAEEEKKRKRPLYQRFGSWLAKEVAKFFAARWLKAVILGALSEAGITAAITAFIVEFWPAIVGLLIVVIVGIILVPIAWHSASGTYGSTWNDYHHSTSLLEAPPSQKVMLESGSGYTKLALNRQIFTDLKSELIKLKSSSNISPEVQKQITDTCTKIDQYLAKSNPATQQQKAALDPTLGKEIITSVRSILGGADQQAPTISAQTRPPLTHIVSYNAWLHNGTPLEPEAPTGLNGQETYIYSRQGKSDAVDLYTDKDSPVYPAFQGKITTVSDDGAGHKKVVIKNGKYEMLYANIDPVKGLTEGNTVTIDKPIGKVAMLGDNQPQVHIELAYAGKPVVTTLIDKMNYSENGTTPWGQYLWNDMRKVLNIK